MGIDIGCALVVGLPFYEVVEDEEFFWRSYEGSLSCFSPYYDAEYGDCLIGISLGGTDYKYEELTENVSAEIVKARKYFKDITGLDAKVFVTPNVS